MVSDSDLVARLRQILQSSDLNTATTASIRRQLESEFGVSLNDRKAFLTGQIDLFITTQFSQPQNDAVQHPPQGDDDDNGNEEIEDVNEDEEQEDNGQVGSEVDEGDESDEQGTKRKRSSNKDKIVKRKASGFSKPCALSPELQELVGVPELARTEVVKRIWAYIREKDLQNPSNKRKIICDHTLRGIFQVDTVDMFRMNKLLSKHIWPIEVENDTSLSKATQKKQDRKAMVKSSSKAAEKKRHKQEDDSKQKGKRQKGQTSGFLAPLQLSEALVKFFGTGESELSRADVVKRLWTYIKENELQDPSDKRIVLCDDKLKELFEVDSFHGFTMTKLLTSHFIKADGR